MQVGDLLELQRTLHADGVVHIAADEKQRRVILIALGKLRDLRIEVDGALHHLRQDHEVIRELGSLFPAQAAALLAQIERQQIQHRHLRGVALRGRNGDLRACPGVDDIVRDAGDRTADDVDDREHIRALGLRLADGGDGVRRLAGLRNDDHERVLVDDRVTVAELTRKVSIDRNVRELFERIFARLTGIKRRAAGRDHDLVEAHELRIGHLQLVKHNAVILHTRVERGLDGTRLLHDLFEHEVLIAALFGSLNIPRDAGNGLFDRLAGAVKDRVAVGTHLGELAVVKIDHIFRVRHKRRHVGGEEVLTRADADDQRTAVAREEHLLRAVGAQNADRIAALQTAERFEHSVLEIAVAGIIHIQQVNDDLRVRLTMEPEPLGLQHLAQLHEVFDDAVLHDGELAVVAHVRMGVRLRRRAVRCPARMAEADIAVKIATVMRFGQQILDLAAGLGKLDRAAVEHGDAGRVITAVFELLQPFEKDRRSLLRADVSNDSTHSQFSLLF